MCSCGVWVSQSRSNSNTVFKLEWLQQLQLMEYPLRSCPEAVMPAPPDSSSLEMPPCVCVRVPTRLETGLLPTCYTLQGPTISEPKIGKDPGPHNPNCRCRAGLGYWEDVSWINPWGPRAQIIWCIYIYVYISVSIYIYKYTYGVPDSLLNPRP